MTGRYGGKISEGREDEEKREKGMLVDGKRKKRNKERNERCQEDFWEK
jgi:hypothetical protein